MKSTMLIAVFMIGTLSLFGSFFAGEKDMPPPLHSHPQQLLPAGTVVAKIPYTPFSLLTNLSHRGITGDDLTDCAYIFIYVQMAYIWRTNIQKAFGKPSLSLSLKLSSNITN